MSTLATLYPTADTFIENLNDATNYGAAGSLIIGERNDETTWRNRALIKWDLSPYEGGTIAAATISLYAFIDRSSEADFMIAYRVKRAWTELGASYDNWMAGSAWETAGCGGTTLDRDSVALGTSASISNAGVTVVTIPLTQMELVQDWVDGGFTNNGVLLRTIDESNDAWGYYSRENGTAQYMPQLIIAYDMPTLDAGYSMIINT